MRNRNVSGLAAKSKLIRQLIKNGFIPLGCLFNGEAWKRGEIVGNMSGARELPHCDVGELTRIPISLEVLKDNPEFMEIDNCLKYFV
jgi:hypothetical protein